MIRLFQYLFFGIAAFESGLILWDCGGPEVMISETWSLEDFRAVLVVSSLCIVATLALLDMEESKGSR